MWEQLPRIEWRVSELTSYLHIIEAVVNDRPVVHEPLRQAVGELAPALRSSIQETVGWNAQIWLPKLLWGSDVTTDLSKLVRGAADDKRFQKDQAPLLVARLEDAIAAIRGVIPDMRKELTIRTRPLREQWEARGPGLMRAVSQFFAANKEYWAFGESENRPAVCCPVYPVLGGAALEHRSPNGVRVEAVLVNPQPDLPEVVRLARALTVQGVFAGNFPNTDHRIHRWGLVTVLQIPLLLHAAEAVGLCECDAVTIQLAIDSWPLYFGYRRHKAEELLARWNDLRRFLDDLDDSP